MAEVRRRRRRVEETVATSVERRDGGVVVDTPVDRVEKNPVSAEAPPAYVRVEGSVTHNMGDFNSVRVGVCIERPCENTDEAIDTTYAEVSARVDRMIQRELDIATGQITT